MSKLLSVTIVSATSEHFKQSQGEQVLVYQRAGVYVMPKVNPLTTEHALQ